MILLTMLSFLLQGYGNLPSGPANISELTPVVVIFVLIVAAAGMTRGADIFAFLGISALAGASQGGAQAGGVGKGARAGRVSAKNIGRAKSYAASAVKAPGAAVATAKDAGKIKAAVKGRLDQANARLSTKGIAPIGSGRVGMAVTNAGRRVQGGATLAGAGLLVGAAALKGAITGKGGSPTPTSTGAPQPRATSGSAIPRTISKANSGFERASTRVDARAETFARRHGLSVDRDPSGNIVRDAQGNIQFRDANGKISTTSNFRFSSRVPFSSGSRLNTANYKMDQASHKTTHAQIRASASKNSEDARTMSKQGWAAWRNGDKAGANMYFERAKALRAEGRAERAEASAYRTQNIDRGKAASIGLSAAGIFLSGFGINLKPLVGPNTSANTALSKARRRGIGLESDTKQEAAIRKHWGKNYPAQAYTVMGSLGTISTTRSKKGHISVVLFGRQVGKTAHERTINAAQGATTASMQKAQEIRKKAGITVPPYVATPQTPPPPPPPPPPPSTPPLGSSGGQPTYAQILGVSQGASPVEIRQAYRAGAKQYHPDTLGSSATDAQKAQANEKMKQLGEARDGMLAGKIGPAATLPVSRPAPGSSDEQKQPPQTTPPKQPDADQSTKKGVSEKDEKEKKDADKIKEQKDKAEKENRKESDSNRIKKEEDERRKRDQEKETETRNRDDERKSHEEERKKHDEEEGKKQAEERKKHEDDERKKQEEEMKKHETEKKNDQSQSQ